MRTGPAYLNWYIKNEFIIVASISPIPPVNPILIGPILLFQDGDDFNYEQGGNMLLSITADIIEDYITDDSGDPITDDNDNAMRY